mmetsp:Transcript_74653/g.216626  ORF Transcript_74653/g.216626 Transcript_74653/m.216626 type:complete len:294 (-) Transcript_74653:954-1835(-)
MGLQFCFSTNSKRSFRKALSWPTWSKPSPFNFPLHNLSKMGVTTAVHLSASGLLMGPSSETTASTVFSCRSLHKSSMSWMGNGKQGGHAPVFVPHSCKVLARTRGIGPVEMHVPQPVPAFVHLLMSANVMAPFLIAVLMTRLDTEWQLQTRSSSASFVPSPPSSTGMSPASSCSGVRPPRLGFFEMAESFAKSLMSPRRMPPSNCLPSGVKTSFLYTPLAASSETRVFATAASSVQYCLLNQKSAEPPKDPKSTPISFNFVDKSLPAYVAVEDLSTRFDTQTCAWWRPGAESP